MFKFFSHHISVAQSHFSIAASNNHNGLNAGPHAVDRSAEILPLELSPLEPSSLELSPKDIAKLIFLAAIWGASFVSMRLVVPEAGSLFTAICRIELAAIALAAFAYFTKIPIHLRVNLKLYTLLGLFGAVLPFIFFCYASQYLPAAFSALFNATCPLFVALFSILWLSEKVSLRKLAGLTAGVTGVLLLVGTGALLKNKITSLAILASLAAPACCALSAIIVKKKSCTHSQTGNREMLQPLSLAVGSMIMAAVILLPLLPFTLPAHSPSAASIGLIVSLALAPSALAQIIFIPLLVKIGPTRAMSVSFLIPVFAILWGFIFLQESVQLLSLVGGAIVLVAIGLILKA